jgi:hypothetical protein
MQKTNTKAIAAVFIALSLWNAGQQLLPRQIDNYIRGKCGMVEAKSRILPQ